MSALSINIGYDTSYPWPIEVKIPDATRPGRFQIHRFTAYFKAMPTDEARDLVGKADKAREDGHRATAMDIDKELLRRVLTGWNLAEPHTTANLEAAMRNAFLLAGMNEGYKQSITGEAVLERAEGNSQTQ